MFLCVLIFLALLDPMCCKEVTLKDLQDRILKLERDVKDCPCYERLVKHEDSDDAWISGTVSQPDKEKTRVPMGIGSGRGSATKPAGDETELLEMVENSIDARSSSRALSSERAGSIRAGASVIPPPPPHSGSASANTSVTGMYAFTAILNKTLSVDTGQDIIFDTVLLNVGNAYNVRDGIFACNYTGIYMFTWNLFTSGYVGAQLRVNGIPLVESYVDVKVLKGYYNAHGSVVIHINAGDYVMLVCDEKGGPLIEKKTTFSGFLIAP